MDERTSLGVRAVLLPVNLLELLHGRRHHVEAVGQEVLLLPQSSHDHVEVVHGAIIGIGTVLDGTKQSIGLVLAILGLDLGGGSRDGTLHRNTKRE